MYHPQNAFLAECAIQHTGKDVSFPKSDLKNRHVPPALHEAQRFHFSSVPQTGNLLEMTRPTPRKTKDLLLLHQIL